MGTEPQPVAGGQPPAALSGAAAAAAASTQPVSSSLSPKDLQLVDISCFQHRRRPGTVASMPAARACPVDPHNVDEVSLWRSLVGQFTTPSGGVRYKDMAIAWNTHYQQLLSSSSAGALRPKQKEHLRSYHLSLTSVQAVQQAMQSSANPMGTSAADTPSWSGDLAALARLGMGSSAAAGSTAGPSSLAVPGLTGYLQPAALLPVGGSGSMLAPQLQMSGWPVLLPASGGMPPPLSPELAALLSAAPTAPALAPTAGSGKNRGGKQSGSYCQACRYLADNDACCWPNVPLSHPDSGGECPQKKAWQAKQSELGPQFESWKNKKQKAWQKWKQQQQQQ